MKKSKVILIVGTIVLCVLAILLFVCIHTQYKPGNSVTTRKEQTTTTKATFTTEQATTLVETTGILKDDHKEQEFYNSLSREERETYEKVRKDEDFGFFGFGIDQSYNRTLPKTKTVKIQGKEILLSYCYTITREVNCVRNPEDINVSNPLNIFIDGDKNNYMFDQYGELREYFAYVGEKEAEKVDTKLTMEQAINSAQGYIEDLFPEIREVKISKSEDTGSEYYFVFHKFISTLMCEETTVQVLYNGKIDCVKSYIFTDTQQLPNEVEQTTLKKLDEYIKLEYGDSIKSYDYGEAITCEKVNDNYVAFFFIVFTDNNDIGSQFVENIVMKIE